MRAELSPPALDRAAVTAWNAAYVAIEAGEHPEPVAARLSDATGYAVTASSVMSAFGSIEPDMAARAMSVPAPAELAGLRPNRAELIEIVHRFDPTSASYDGSVNEAWWSAVFEANTPRPDAANALFHPPDGAAGWTAEQVVDYALGYRPIAL